MFNKTGAIITRINGRDSVGGAGVSKTIEFGFTPSTGFYIISLNGNYYIDGTYPYLGFILIYCANGLYISLSKGLRNATDGAYYLLGEPKILENTDTLFSYDGRLKTVLTKSNFTIGVQSHSTNTGSLAADYIILEIG